MSNYEKNIHGRIREVRLSIKLSLTAFAKMLGFSVSYLSEVENKKTKPSLSLLYKISSLPKIDGHWLLTGEGEMTRKPKKEVGVAEDTPAYNKEEVPVEADGPDHALKDKLIQTQGKLIKQMEKRLAETEEKLKISEKLADRIREEDADEHRGEILKKRAM